jgi:hypothetical protein
MYNVNKLPLDKLTTKDLVKVDRDYKEKVVPAPYFVRDNKLFMNLETDVMVADYYMGMFICPDVEAWAEKNGGYWEWVNPGCLEFVEQ